MGDIPIPDLSLMSGLLSVCIAVSALFLANVLYNVYLHPLRHVPGPFWARATGIPSWYYSFIGKRHIWMWQLFQIHGKRIRVTPNSVIFCDPRAHADIYSMKSNVRRSPFYVGLTKSIREQNTLNTIDPTEHARKRKILDTGFTDVSVSTAATFITQHIDRWHQIMLDEHGSSTEWSASMDFSHKIDHLAFDIMGELAFGRSFNTKEPGENPLKEVPNTTIQYFKFYYPMCHSPLLSLIIWLKPRGLDRLMELVTPQHLHEFDKFVIDSVTKRLELYEKQKTLAENERRRDIMYFLCQAQDSSTGHKTYTEVELRAEALLLIIAGSDTTTTILSGILWYLTRYPRCYQKLVDELQGTFETPEDAVHGPKLVGCKYLRACIDETMRLVPPGPSESPREVLPGGINIMNEHYPPGTIVSTSPWSDGRNEEVYGDPAVFRPERWIATEDAGVTTEMVAKIRSNLRPFRSGPGNCAGKNIAMAEIMLVVAKTLLRFDFRKTPGSTLGEGSAELGWGQRDRKQFQLVDAFVSVREGPEIQFRKRAPREVLLG
ncbi:benzoate 4-monooxygenase cytochrome P450 [Xylariomycetidae sp. FL2044]|nr:benzoate 4-monooxygenase cytochrome P450 [Xylariomycetidae sp. FL2044]